MKGDVDMTGFKPRKEEFYIEDDKKTIHITLEGEKYVGWHSDDDGNIVDEIDQNQIEFSYYEADEDGMSAGIDEFISTCDIKNMADGIRSVLHHQTGMFRYHCQDDIFLIELSYDNGSDLYYFTAALLETLCRDSHITITKERLTISSMEEYIHPLLEWEKMYPIYFNT